MDLLKGVRWNPPPASTSRESTREEDTGRTELLADGQNAESKRLDMLKTAFITDLPAMMEGNTIAQSFATRVTRRERFFREYGAGTALNASERVVRSHLRYLDEFEPFKNGLITKSSLYEFLFYMIVERGRRESYTKRVIKTIMAYLKAGGASAMGVLTDESKDYIDSFRGFGGVKMSTFYRRMDVLANTFGDDRVKRILSAARCKRPLVFNDVEESSILSHCIRVLRASVDKYVGHSASRRNVFFDRDYDRKIDLAIDIDINVTESETKPGRLRYERTIFEFAFAYVLGFLSGARIKSTVLRFSLDDVKTLLSGGRLEVLTKGVFVNVFLPAEVLKNDADLYGQLMTLRTQGRLYREESYTGVEPDVEEESVDSTTEYDDEQIPPIERSEKRFFTRTPRRLELMLDRVYKRLFENKKRTKGVRWHSQRRRYLGAVNSKYGAVTASESVGHRDLLTTMAYINNSLHMDDVRRKAGEAITERYESITGRSTIR